jgi:CDP-glucose 4,6-dehydratase
VELSGFWSARRVFVTGATGLVGSWLVRELVDRGAYVVCLVRDWDPQSELMRSGTINRTSVINGQLENYATLERAIVTHETDTVIHLGAETIVGSALKMPLQAFESNVRGTYNLLEACRVHSKIVKRVAVASSDKAYGTAERLPYDETMPVRGQHPYDVSKSCTDLISQTYFHTYGTPVVVARCGNIYGGGDLNWSRLVPGTIRSLHRGEAPVIRSDGEFLRDYVFVKDAVEAYLRMAERADEPGVAGEAFNFGPSEPKSVIDIVDALRRVMGREDLQPEIRDEAKAEIRDQYLDSSKAARVLGLTSFTPLDAGLCETVAWYEKFLGGEA